MGRVPTQGCFRGYATVCLGAPSLAPKDFGYLILNQGCFALFFLGGGDISQGRVPNQGVFEIELLGRKAAFLVTLKLVWALQSSTEGLQLFVIVIQEICNQGSFPTRGTILREWGAHTKRPCGTSKICLIRNIQIQQAHYQDQSTLRVKVGSN